MRCIFTFTIRKYQIDTAALLTRFKQVSVDVCSLLTLFCWRLLWLVDALADLRKDSNRFYLLADRCGTPQDALRCVALLAHFFTQCLALRYVTKLTGKWKFRFYCDNKVIIKNTKVWVSILQKSVTFMVFCKNYTFKANFADWVILTSFRDLLYCSF